MIVAKGKELAAKALALMDRLLEVLRDKLHFLKPYSPSFAPTKWIYINGACCMITAMFFLLGMMTEKSMGYQAADTFYIPFNLAICLTWFVEASLWMIFDEEGPAWHKIGELGLAAFFILDGMVWIYEWAFEGIKLHRREILIYTAIDFFIYLFYLCLAIRAEAKATEKELAQGEEGSGDVEASAVPASEDKKEAETEFKLMA